MSRRIVLDRSLGVAFPRGASYTSFEAPIDANSPDRVWRGSPSRILVPASGLVVPLFSVQFLLSQLYIEADISNVAPIALGTKNIEVTPAVPGFSTSTITTLDPGESVIIYTDDAAEFFDAGTWNAAQPGPADQFLNVTFWKYTG